MTFAPAQYGPRRTACLTEETTDSLYLLGQHKRIVGISGYTVPLRRAREEKPKVSAVLSAKIDKILALELGPAALTDGVKPIHRTVMEWAIRHG